MLLSYPYWYILYHSLLSLSPTHLVQKSVKERSLMKHTFMKKHKKNKTLQISQIPVDTITHFIQFTNNVISSIHSFCDFCSDSLDEFLLAVCKFLSKRKKMEGQ